MQKQNKNYLKESFVIRELFAPRYLAKWNFWEIRFGQVGHNQKYKSCMFISCHF